LESILGKIALFCNLAKVENPLKIPNTYKFIHLAFCALLCCACQPTRLVPEQKHLLEKNTVKVDKPVFEKDELKSIIKQKPNRKILGVFRFHLGVYNFAALGKETRFKRWLKNTVGEEPVIQDTLLTNKSALQLKQFLNNKGYFQSEVTDSTVYRKKKASVTYSIKLNEPYIIQDLDYIIEDPQVKMFLSIDTIHSHVKANQVFDQDKLEAERERITKLLKNLGYYNFYKEYIYFEADTNQRTRRVDLDLVIKNPAINAGDTSEASGHQRFYINNIYVTLNYNPKGSPVAPDTLVYNDYYFLTKGPLAFKPSLISQNCFVKKGDLYQVVNVDDTYKKFGDLKVFKLINISFAENKTLTNQNLLDCSINLSPIPKQSFTVETEGTHRSGNLGIAGNLVYQNKNAFRGAELFEIRLKGGLEAQQLVSNSEDKVETFLPFNTVEIGPEFNLYFPKFLLPFKLRKISKRANPKTNFTAAYNFQRRPDYTRTIANVSLGYFWKETQYKRHTISPIDINLVKVNKSATFEQRLNESGDFLIQNSYSDQLITSSKWNYVYNDQGAKQKSAFTFFRSNLELAGNTLSSLNNFFNYASDTLGKHEIFNIKYAQYIRADIDYRKYFNLNEISTLVTRMAVGIGAPYGNSQVLPFIKSFYGGGANDIRAWRARSLGPGALPDSLRSQFEQIGDIKFIGNIEYRFDIYKLLKAALFYDIGNVWLLREDEKRPGGKFELNKFYNELAMGTGVGLRFDFSFFIIRLDSSIPVKNPAYPEGFRWVIKHPQIKDLNFNLGIGYPF